MPSGRARAVSACGTAGSRSGCEQAPTIATATVNSTRSGNLGIEPFQLGDFLRRQLRQIKVALSVAREAMRAVDGAAAAADQLAGRGQQADARDLVSDEHQVAVVHP